MSFDISKLKFVQEIYAWGHSFFGTSTEAELHQKTEEHKTLTFAGLQEQLKTAALEAVKAQMDGLNTQIQEISGNLNTLKESLEAKTKEAAELQTQLNDANAAHVKTLAEKEAEHGKQISNLEGQLSALKAGKSPELDVKTETIPGADGKQAKVNVVENKLLSEFFKPKVG